MYLNSDLPIVLQLYDDDDETEKVNIDDLVDLQVRLAIGQLVIDQWNKDGSGDFKALTRIDAYNYLLNVEISADSKLGYVDLWIEPMTENLSLSDSIQNDPGVQMNFISIEQKPY